ncbi:MAG: hypothetical protein K2J51_08725, partial [Alistipes sp.]|nr:hypothetical protein [Alistipes sp.]
MKKLILYAALLLAAANATAAEEGVFAEYRDTIEVRRSPSGMSLNNRFLPTSRRIDRDINKNKFVFKGET